MTAKRLGVFGGTFDPIHVAHLALAAAVQSALRLDQVLFVPAGDPWQKSTFSPARRRLAMVELAVSGNPRFAVSTVDIDRAGPTYTADTLTDLHASHPDAELFFLLGADALAGFDTWHRQAEILSLATLVVVARPEAAAPADVPGDKVIEVDAPRLDLSATELRARIAAGSTVRYLVPDAVLAYIDQHGLYAEPATNGGAARSAGTIGR